MKVSVIIPTLEKNKAYLKKCVESLRATVDWDIIVVSNGGKHIYPTSDISGISFRLHTADQGQCGAVNKGASVANPNSEYLFIVNDDMYFAPGWNKNLKFDYPVFSPNLLEPEKEGGSAPPFYTAPTGFTLDEFKQKEVDKLIPELIKEHEGEEETGLNFPLFVRKDVWDRIGGYDTTYDPWGSNSDTDLQAKFHLAGIQTMRVRDVVVYHFSMKSGTFDGTHQAEWQHNWDYFTHKWGFNRDTVPGCDVWYSKNILPDDPDEIEYTPEWAGEYGA